MRRAARPKPDYNGWVFVDAEPLDEIYAECILVPCPRCHAQEGEFCTNPVTHKRTKLPCLCRMNA